MYVLIIVNDYEISTVTNHLNTESKSSHKLLHICIFIIKNSVLKPRSLGLKVMTIFKLLFNSGVYCEGLQFISRTFVSFCCASSKPCRWCRKSWGFVHFFSGTNGERPNYGKNFYVRVLPVFTCT